MQMDVSLYLHLLINVPYFGGGGEQGLVSVSQVLPSQEVLLGLLPESAAWEPQLPDSRIWLMGRYFCTKL